MSIPISIGIAEDHELLRQGLVNLLKDYKDITVLFDVGNGKELLEQLKNERPDILLLDVKMPVLSGKEALEKIRLKYPKLKTIIVSGFFHEDYIIEFFKLGVRAFLPKDYTIDKVVEAIQSVHTNGGYYDTKVSMILADALKHAGSRESGQKQAVLSGREIEVLKLICTDKTSKEASDLLDVQKSTVDFHRKNIMRKTNSKNFPALVAYAIKNKLITPGW